MTIQLAKPTDKIELVVDKQVKLGEGACWDPDTQCLYWVDILGKSIHIYNPESGEDKAIGVGTMVGSLAVREAGGLITATTNGFATFDLDSHELNHIAHPETHLPGNRFNDGKCDPAGRFLAGTMAFEETQGAGSLYSLGSDHQVTTLLEDVTISNGLGWSPDHKTFYYNDSPTRQVLAFNYDLETGQISHGRVIITIPETMGYPDGMTTDEAGTLWIALWSGGVVGRWSPDGTLLQTIALPAYNVTCPIFGGPHLNHLYITTARKGMAEKQLEQYPKAGGLFRLKLDGVKGMPSFKFKG